MICLPYWNDMKQQTHACAIAQAQEEKISRVLELQRHFRN
jgi:hypothetical protein